MKREIALRELKLLDAVRRKFMTHQQKVQDVEVQRLDDELERKVSYVPNVNALLCRYNIIISSRMAWQHIHLSTVTSPCLHLHQT